MLPSYFRCITGVECTYHHHIYHSSNNWIKLNIPLLKLLISLFQLKYMFFLCRLDILTPCPFDYLTQIIQEACLRGTYPLLPLFRINVMIVLFSADRVYIYHPISYIFHNFSILHHFQPLQILF